MIDPDDRLIELLTERGERVLSKSESAELSSLLEQNEGWHINDFDYASAAADIALAPPADLMPEALKSRIISDALSRATAMNHPSPSAAQTGAAPSSAPPVRTPDQALTKVSEAVAANDDKPTKGSARMSMWLGWTAAAAAAALAVIGWQDDLRPQASISELRAALVEQETAVKVAWTQTKDPLGTKVTGDVVWSNARQEGYMRFSGLPQNDPSKHQYQLWIFDQDRDERFPVDGGVFDIDSATGDVIVDIRAKIRVKKATLFAITLEKPGGVVVSTRERLVTLAKPEA